MKENPADPAIEENPCMSENEKKYIKKLRNDE